MVLIKTFIGCLLLALTVSWPYLFNYFFSFYPNRILVAILFIFMLPFSLSFFFNKGTDEEGEEAVEV